MQQDPRDSDHPSFPDEGWMGMQVIEDLEQRLKEQMANNWRDADAPGGKIGAYDLAPSL